MDSPLVDEQGRLVVAIPDPVMSKIGTREELELVKGRSVLDFSHSLLNAVEPFVDELIDIFVRWKPERFTDGGTWSPT